MYIFYPDCVANSHICSLGMVGKLGKLNVRLSGIIGIFEAAVTIKKKKITTTTNCNETIGQALLLVGTVLLSSAFPTK